MRFILIAIGIMLLLGFLGFAQNGFSTACKPPYHLQTVGDSQVCG